MRVMVLGLRGFPGIQGGVETHAEHLYPLLVKMGCEVDVIVRSPYVPKGSTRIWNGVRFRRIWAPQIKGIETLVHSFLSVFYAGFKRPDVLHIHAVGPALVTPLGRAFGLRVVVTHHGADYDREKWNFLGNWILRIGESLGMHFANCSIVISKVIKEMVRRKYGCKAVLIPNGVSIPKLPDTKFALKKFGLKSKRYVLQVSRLVPEKRQTDLIQAFAQAELPGWKLVLVGSTEYPDDYVKALLSLAEKTPNVILTGFQTGLTLQELYAHAGIFVLPSSHEGLPIVLLEALSYGLRVIASDIPANLEVGLPGKQYFPLGDIKALSEMLREVVRNTLDEQDCERRRIWVKERYDWERIAEQTLAVYTEIAKGISKRCE
ncbi:MAG TPA: glycosyltransferase [Thermodesulforhabdus norvegica]|uniref:Glycosyltransferase n=1 Tax=Thermodesulforhabdus norvegica TaxID=39841 RepID=A0A7C0WSR4_9BACT|nr:glycosyltransferase [Thermodesulforhabdus norvegica]